MSKLICAAISSLDGYIEDENGQFGWARPDEEVHEQVVLSRTLEGVGTAWTRLVRELRADEVRAMLETADRDMTIAGPGLAAAALAAGLVDQIHAFREDQP